MNNTYIHIFKNTYIYTQLNKHIEKKTDDYMNYNEYQKYLPSNKTNHCIKKAESFILINHSPIIKFAIFYICICFTMNL